MAPGCHREAPPAFDLPTAMGAEFHPDIDTLTARLGPAVAAATNESGLATKTWRKDGATLTAAYKAASKRVVSVSVIAKPDSEALRDDSKLKLLRAATLPENEGSGSYSVEWIEARDRPTFSVGFRVVPTPRTHKVALIVTGTDATLTVSFQPTTTLPAGAIEASGAFMTIPPWRTAFDAPDDAKITLQTRIFQNNVPGSPFSMRAQIEVDGKIVSDQESKGLPLSINYEI